MGDLRLLINISNPQCYNYGFKYLHASDNHSFLFCPSARQANKQHYGFAAQHASHWIKEQAAAGLNMKPEAAKDRRPKCNATSTSFKPNPSRGAPPSRAPITGHRCLGVPLVVLRRSAAQRPLRTAVEGRPAGAVSRWGALNSRKVQGLRD